MGVPAFFRWLTMRNPKIVLDCDQPAEDETSGNPDIDNFYIDMNGLIHPSCNPQQNNVRIPTCFQQQCENVFDYIDKLMNIIRPKRMVYMAIDGVAPRAKMNQQRSRRFRAAKERELVVEKKEELRQFYVKHGIYNQEIDDYLSKKPFDSNVITPGTQFLCDLSLALKFYIVKRMNHHSLWKHLKIVFSDANNPGEGQHKIMEYIRQQRACHGYDPNQSHCIYGADADLIMLGLMTHQPRFYIIRQVIITRDQKKCANCGRPGHLFTQCTGGNDGDSQNQIAVSFQFVRLQYVRDQLHFHFNNVEVPFGYHLERIIDDFVFMCFFVGNDFLPHLPSLNIREGGIDVLIYTYERILHKLPGYLIDAGILNLPSVDIFMTQLGKLEDSLIEENTKKQEIMRRRERNQADAYGALKPDKDKTKEINFEEYLKNPLEKFKQDLKNATTTELNIQGYSEFYHDVFNYKEKFYTQKFKIAPLDFVEFKHKISQSYIQALSWICLYYYKGVQSWGWYYPYHYSPFISDIKVLEYDQKKFEIGRPFKPFEQLMAVFPPKTSWAIPQCLQHLMQSIHSPIADYFPSDFIIDVLGKKFSWMGEVLLPFIEQSRLLQAMGEYERQLSAQEFIRNSLGNSLIFFRPDYHAKFPTYHSHVNHQVAGIEGECKPVEKGAVKLNEKINNPLGFVWQAVQNNQVYCFVFYSSAGKPHIVELKDGIKLEEYEVNDEYVGKTDRRSFNGERMLGIVNRLLGPSPKKGVTEEPPSYRRSDSGQYNNNNYGNNYSRNNYQRGNQYQYDNRNSNQYYNRNSSQNNYTKKQRSRSRDQEDQKYHGKHYRNKNSYNDKQ